MPYYVSGIGSDGYTAAQAQNLATPWQTLRKALMTAPSGEVRVRSGNYAQVNVAADNITKSAELVVKPYSGELPVIDGLTTGVMRRVTFDGLRFKNTLTFGTETPARQVDDTKLIRCDLDMEHVDGRNALQLYWIKDSFTVDSCTIQNVDKVNLSEQGGRGIYVGGDISKIITNLRIVNNTLKNLQEDGIEFGDGVYSSGTFIEGNLFDNVSSLIPNSDGLAHTDAISAGGPHPNLTISNNRFAGGHRGIILLFAAATGLGHYDGLVMEGNDIAQSPLDFAVRAYSARNARIVNNTFWAVPNQHGASGNGGYFEVYYKSPNETVHSTGIVFKNNIVKRLLVGNNGGTVTFAEREYNLYGTTPAVGLGTGDIVGAPTFEDEAAADLRLAAGSLGIDTGEPAPTDAPTSDLLGYSRPVGARNDMGAYEFSGVPTLELADSLTLTDGVNQSASMAFFDTVPWQDEMTMNVSPSLDDLLLLADSFTLTDDIAASAGLAFSDSLAFTDGFQMAVSLEVED